MLYQVNFVNEAAASGDLSQRSSIGMSVPTGSSLTTATCQVTLVTPTPKFRQRFLLCHHSEQCMNDEGRGKESNFSNAL